MLTYFAVILVTLVLMSIYILGVLQESLENNESVRLFAKANIISDAVAPYIENPSNFDGNMQTRQILAGTSVRGVAVNQSCTVVYDSNEQTSLAVSYTHLDVYKRQRYFRIIKYGLYRK